MVPHEQYILDRESVRAVDRAAIEEFGIPGIVLMENAARGLAAEALRRLPAGGRATIVCGGGNNGGDGWALGRHLHNAGVEVTLVPLRDPRPESDAGVNCAICRAMELAEADVGSIDGGADLLVDAIFGTGLDRPVSGEAADVIEKINRAGRPVLSVDVPSGLDCDTGEPLGTTVRASVTVTFVARKPGMIRPEAAIWTGEVIVADIGAPVELLKRYGQPAR